MRICLVTREYPSLGAHGGIGTYTQQLARGLAARGNEVVVIAHGAGAPFDDGGFRVEPVAAADSLKLPAFNRYFGATRRTIPFVVAAGARYRALAALSPFDVVEVPEYQGWGLGVALVADAPVLARLHTHTRLVRRLNDEPFDADAKAVHALEAATLSRAGMLLANSEALAAVATADFGLPAGLASALALPVDAERFRPGRDGALRARLGAGPDTRVLLYAGRIERRKGVETMLEAFAALVASQPDVVLALAGADADAALRARLEERARALGVESRLAWLGHVPHAELPALYAGCDVFLAPSRYEPFGLIYLEAMACERPVVGCAAGGVPEIVEDGVSGRLVPPDDAPALAAALSGLLAEPQAAAAMGRAGRAAVLSRYALPVVAAATEACYATLAARRPRKEGMAHAAT